MRRLNITAVCYLNTIPYVFGLNRASQELRADILLATPANCTKNFIEKKADIALIPAADIRLLDLKECSIITPFCIGADKLVRTVVVVSNHPIESVESIYLDSHSHTSVELVKILANEHWNIAPTFKPLTEYTFEDANDNVAYLLIGDKVFEHESKFSYCYDLANIWNSYTSLPFVFAVWVAYNSVDKSDIAELSNALEFGVNHIEESVDSSNYSDNKARNIDYLKNNINYIFDSEKKLALNKFLQKIPPSSL
ncbi:MAG: menaquinone biosynthesis protein [Rikenellaceae bacterium]